LKSLSDPEQRALQPLARSVLVDAPLGSQLQARAFQHHAIDHQVRVPADEAAEPRPQRHDDLVTLAASELRAQRFSDASGTRDLVRLKARSCQGLSHLEPRLRDPPLVSKVPQAAANDLALGAANEARGHSMDARRVESPNLVREGGDELGAKIGGPVSPIGCAAPEGGVEPRPQAEQEEARTQRRRRRQAAGENELREDEILLVEIPTRVRKVFDDRLRPHEPREAPSPRLQVREGPLCLLRTDRPHEASMNRFPFRAHGRLPSGPASGAREDRWLEASSALGWVLLTTATWRPRAVAQWPRADPSVT
jgi:hypothetical protein